MIQSMTGYGKGEAVVGENSSTAEIRSVNGRYLEVSVKLPQNLSTREIEVREMVRQQIYRGKVSVSVSVSGLHDDDEISVDPESVKRVIDLLKSLKKYSRISSPIKLEHILSFKDVLKGAGSESAGGEDWEAAKSAVSFALDQLKESRRVEGLSLRKDLSERIHKLDSKLDKVEGLSRLHVDEEKSKLRRKVDEVLGGREIDPARIELEIVLLADKLDITEEIVRFRTHNRFFEDLLNGEDSNGRRLNFLLQEMNREANTMGSKSFDAEMSHLVVEVKEELEKLREQVQNLE
jgi:uncharacterized protein (TIGR00255 family)